MDADVNLLRAAIARAGEAYLASRVPRLEQLKLGCGRSKVAYSALDSKAFRPGDSMM